MDAARRTVEEVETAQEGALAGAGRADDRDHFALADLGVDVLEHGDVAEALGQMLDPDHRATAVRRRVLGIGDPLQVVEGLHEDPRDEEAYSTATMISGKNASKVRLRMMSLAFVKSCTAI